MKFFISVSIFILMTLITNSFAGMSSRLAIEGKVATKVIDGLVKAGFPVQKTEYGDFISASKIDCTRVSIGQQVSAYCIAYDYQKLVVKIEDADALTLFSSLSGEAVNIPSENSGPWTFSIYALDCLDWNVVAGPGESQQVPTCLFKRL
jgi:hypothetical protein